MRDPDLSWAALRSRPLTSMGECTCWLYSPLLLTYKGLIAYWQYIFRLASSHFKWITKSYAGICKYFLEHLNQVCDPLQPTQMISSLWWSALFYNSNQPFIHSKLIEPFGTCRAAPSSTTHGFLCLICSTPNPHFQYKHFLIHCSGTNECFSLWVVYVLNTLQTAHSSLPLGMTIQIPGLNAII